MLRSRKTGWIGVDVGTHSVKLAQVERQGDGYALTEAVVIQRSEPWAEKDTTAAHVCDSREQLIAGRTLGEQFAGSRSAATLPMAICQFKSLYVPERSAEERRRAIASELAGSPLPGVASREFDFWPVTNRLENATIVRENVSVLSLASDSVARLVRDQRQAGLDCQVVDGIPLALGRAIGMRPGPGASGPVAALDWGFTRATFCIVFEGEPLFVRCLRDCEYGAMIRALRDTLGLTWDEARRVACDHACCSPTGRSLDDGLHSLVSEIVRPSLNQLVSELQRTLVYLRAHRRSLVPERMWLFGGGAVVQGVAPWLEEQVNVESRCWDLGRRDYCSSSAGSCPVPLLGPAIALSALAWEAC